MSGREVRRVLDVEHRAQVLLDLSMVKSPLAKQGDFEIKPQDAEEHVDGSSGFRSQRHFSPS